MATDRQRESCGFNSSTPVIFSDFDGTITQVDVTDLLLTQFAHPSWREIEQEWVCGSIGSRECLERQMALVEASAEELDALTDSVRVDPHFAKFHQSVRSRGLPLYVVSDGFDYVVRRVLKRTGLPEPGANGTDVFASRLEIEGRKLRPSFPYSGPPCKHGCATCKQAVIRRLRARPALRAGKVIFIGDGLSDRFAAEESDLVFAKRQLLAYCRQRQIACKPFETFADIEAEMEKLTGSTRPARRPRLVATAI